MNLYIMVTTTEVEVSEVKLKSSTAENLKISKISSKLPIVRAKRTTHTLADAKNNLCDA